MLRNIPRVIERRDATKSQMELKAEYNNQNFRQTGTRKCDDKMHEVPHPNARNHFETGNKERVRLLMQFPKLKIHIPSPPHQTFMGTPPDIEMCEASWCYMFQFSQSLAFWL